jgi:hypothetical protein
MFTRSKKARSTGRNKRPPAPKIDIIIIDGFPLARFAGTA